MVSQRGHNSMAARLTPTNTTNATSSALRRSDAIPTSPHGLDRRLGAELASQPPDAHVHNVRPRIEVIAPDSGEDALAAHHLAGVLDEMVQQPELPVRQIYEPRADPDLPPGEIEHDLSGRHGLARLRCPRPQLHANAGKQLVEGERLGHVVVGPQLEAAQLGAQV